MDEEMDFGQPVSEGDEVVVTVEDMGSKGDGIARIEGFVIFVPDTEIGETVKIKVDTVGSKFAFGEVVERDVSERYEKEEVEDEDYEKEEVEEDFEQDYEKEPEEEDEDYEKEVRDYYDHD